MQLKPYRKIIKILIFMLLEKWSARGNIFKFGHRHEKSPIFSNNCDGRASANLLTLRMMPRSPKNR